LKKNAIGWMTINKGGGFVKSKNPYENSKSESKIDPKCDGPAKIVTFGGFLRVF